MKKKIITFLLALCFILPFSFVMVACNPTNPPPSDPPPTGDGGGDGFELADAVAALNALELDFTSQVTASYTMELVENQGATSTSQSQNQSLQNIVLRFDDAKNMSIDIPSVISLAYIDGYLYSSQQDMNSYSNNLGVLIDGIEQVFGECDVKLGDILQEGVDLAQMLNQNAVSINEKTTGTDVTVKFEIAPLVSRMQKAIKDHKDAKLGEFINKFAKDVFDVDFDIGDFADSVVEFVTDATTFGDILEHIETETGIDMDKILDLFEKFPFRSMFASGVGGTYTGSDRVETCQWPEVSFDAYKNEKVLETMGITKTELIQQYPEIKAMYLDNADVTFAQLLTDNTDEQTAATVFEVLDVYTVGKLDISVVLNFDENNKLVGYQLKGDGKVTEKISALSSNDYIVSGTISATLANVGSTLVTMPTGFDQAYTTITTITSRTMLAIKNNTITLDDPYMKDFTIQIQVYDEDLEDYVDKTVATYNSTTKKLVLDEFLLQDSAVNEIMLIDYTNNYMITIFIQ